MSQQDAILIGIDPDVDKSGVAIKTPSGMDMKTLNFFALFDYLRSVKKYANEARLELCVFVECGYLNKGNRHKVLGGSLSLNSKIGEHIGQNHQVAKKILEMCEYLGLNYQEVRPTKTKLDSNQFNEKTGYKKRTNQEQRDAMMLIWEK